jgi:hypothetical protein
LVEIRKVESKDRFFFMFMKIKPYLLRNMTKCSNIVHVLKSYSFSRNTSLLNPLNLIQKPCPSKREISSFQSKAEGLILETECPIYAFLILPRVKLTPSPSFTPYSRNTLATPQTLSHGDLKVPPWNFLVLGWIQLPKSG